jgi:hypothetical protein
MSCVPFFPPPFFPQGRELAVQPRVTIGVVLTLAAACVVQWGVKVALG